jgi:hypothetical protein
VSPFPKNGEIVEMHMTMILRILIHQMEERFKHPKYFKISKPSSKPAFLFTGSIGFPIEQVLNVQVLHSGHSQRRASCTRLPFTFHGGPSGSGKEEVI